MTIKIKITVAQVQMLVACMQTQQHTNKKCMQLVFQKCLFDVTESNRKIINLNRNIQLRIKD